MTKESRPIYPPQEDGRFENFIAKTPFAEDYWEEIEEEMESTSNKQNIKNQNNHNMEIGEEVIFESLNDNNLRDESQVEIDSIIRNMDMSDHNYKDNMW